MNFFDRQDNARKTTTRLIILFVIAVVAVVLAIDLVVAAILATTQVGSPLALAALPLEGQNLSILAGSSLATLGLIGVSSLVKVTTLSAGGGKVARSLGGTLITPDVQDPLRQRLHNVVEEMAIASGVPVPEVYVLEEEEGINAFAAGFTTGDAAVAVTRGALDRLTRAELQGVIAHEFSHILNGDMRINMRLIGILFGILVIGMMGRIILRSGSRSSFSRSNNRGGSAFAIGAALFVVGYVGFFFGRLIKAAVSRQREYLADASAVQFTRQTDGLAGALKKIGGFPSGSEVKDPSAEEVSHMFFAKGFASLKSVFATHPPLNERIQALEPSFKASDFGVGLPEPQDLDAWSQINNERVSAFAYTPEANRVEVVVDEVTDSVGNPTMAHVHHAAEVRASLPQTLYEASQGQEGAMLLLIALILNPVRATRHRQLGAVRGKLGVRRANKAVRFFDELAELGHQYRLPLLELAFPTLKARPASELEFLTEFVEELVQLDGKVEPFEYALMRMLLVHLGDAKRPRRSLSRRHTLKLEEALPEVAQLLSVVAWVGGHSNEESAANAFGQGRTYILDSVGEGNDNFSDFEKPEDWLDHMDHALDQCDRLEDHDKEVLIHALAVTIVHDGVVTQSEGEFLRAICASIHCPLPPLI
ncbi:MAG: M48 family metallopeptidase [Pseudomonadota bacterium]